jgi:hypothetical protein
LDLGRVEQAVMKRRVEERMMIVWQKRHSCLALSDRLDFWSVAEMEKMSWVLWKFSRGKGVERKKSRFG